MSETIDLGTVTEVEQLFSYPNNPTDFLIPQSLAETVKHYLKTSIERDGFSNFKLDITENDDGHVIADISGDAAAAYAASLPRYLEIGMDAYRVSKKIHEVKGKWECNWRFFLPHGVAMTRHLTVELMHFPPDYVLECDQDYLAAHTTRRWAELLKVNGLQEQETPRYQNIIDIAPIAAPSWHGRKLTKADVYSDYDDYIKGLLRLWGRGQNDQGKPIVAFGSPVRKWIKSAFGPDLDVLSLTTLGIDDDLSFPTLAAYHPAFIYNADEEDDPDTPEDEHFDVLTAIMQKDLIAARWQTKVGQNLHPDGTPEEILEYYKGILEDCKGYWSDPMRKRCICELTRIQVLNEDPDEAAKHCADIVAPPVRPFPWAIEEEERTEAEKEYVDRIERRLESLREKIGDLDSREPDHVQRMRA